MAKGLDTKNVDKALTHDCAKHVVHEQWGKGNCIPEMHTLEEGEDGIGHVTHYDVMFEHGVEQNVPVEDLEIVVSESHMHSKKKVKEEVELDEGRPRREPASPPRMDPPVSAQINTYSKPGRRDDYGFALFMKFKDGTTELMPSAGKPSMEVLKKRVDKYILKNPERKSWIPVISAAMKKGPVRIKGGTPFKFNKEEVTLDEGLEKEVLQMDPVNKKELKKKYKDRKDKDIDNDGDEDESDKYLHMRRKAVSKAITKKKED